MRIYRNPNLNFFLLLLLLLLFLAAPNALGETAALRERWLREVFERAVLETSSSSLGAPLLNDATATDNNVDCAAETLATNCNVELDQDAAMALLKEINADLATGRIRQKMAVSLLCLSACAIH